MTEEDMTEEDQIALATLFSQEHHSHRPGKMNSSLVLRFQALFFLGFLQVFCQTVVKHRKPMMIIWRHWLFRYPCSIRNNEIMKYCLQQRAFIFIFIGTIDHIRT
jgi:hypothetical protein